MSINTTIIYGAGSGSADRTASQIADTINAQTAATGVVATLGGAGGNEISLSAADGRNITVTETLADAGQTGGIIAGTEIVATGNVMRGTITLTSTVEAGITVGGTPALIGHAADTTAATTVQGINNVSVTTVAGANSAIAAIDSALTDISSARGDLGAIQNRFESVVSNLMVTSENLTAAKDRIMDADFAAETANMTRSMVLQQSWHLCACASQYGAAERPGATGVVF